MYASPETITRSSATLGPNRGPYGWQDSDLLGGYERFPILFPLSQALHGTLSALRLRRVSSVWTSFGSRGRSPHFLAFLTALRSAIARRTTTYRLNAPTVSFEVERTRYITKTSVLYNIVVDTSTATHFQTWTPLQECTL